MDIVQEGDTITVEYEGRLEDGTVFDSSDKHDEPLEFTVGEGKIIKGFDQAVVGMKVGEEKEVIVPPEQAYGQHNPELVRDLPRNVFPEDQEIQQGMVFMMSLPDGRQVPVRIAEVADETVKVDLNSPLAGKTLKFTIKIVSIAS
jgi:FKBP-type peptidyl-prolyl cis-trans isomerase 2